MKVVVVGATGNVGTSVVEALAADPAVTEISRGWPGGPRRRGSRRRPGSKRRTSGRHRSHNIWGALTLWYC